MEAKPLFTPLPHPTPRASSFPLSITCKDLAFRAHYFLLSSHTLSKGNSEFIKAAVFGARVEGRDTAICRAVEAAVAVEEEVEEGEEAKEKEKKKE